MLEEKRAALTEKIEAHIAADREMVRRMEILKSCKGVGPVLTATHLADMPELFPVDHRKAKALAGLAPINHDSGKMRGRLSQVPSLKRSLRLSFREARDSEVPDTDPGTSPV